MTEQIEWEYKHISFDANDSDQAITDALKGFGHYGWELVSREFHPETDDEQAFYTAVFKRPKIACRVLGGLTNVRGDERSVGRSRLASLAATLSET